MTEEAKLELSVEVPGTPEQVWEAIATGGGIGSWFVPAEVDPIAGGRAVYDFGTFGRAPATVVEVTAPERFVVKGQPLTDTWTVTALTGDTCEVRLVSTGFEAMDGWDGDYDGYANGWRIFLANLRRHLSRFAGQKATAFVPTVFVKGPHERAWKEFATALGLPAAPEVGQQVTTEGEGRPVVAGVVDAFVAGAKATHMAMVLTHPAPGHGFVAVEGDGDTTAASVYLYLYGDRVPAEDPITPWLVERFPRPGS